MNLAWLDDRHFIFVSGTTLRLERRGMRQKNLTETVGWAEILPFSDRVFKKNEINQCCRGRAADRAGGGTSLQLSEILGRIGTAALDRNEVDRWNGLSLRDLAQRILTSLHRPLGIHILNAETLIEMIESSHKADAADTVRQLRAAFSDFRREVMSHLFSEEDVLYPWIFSGNGWSALELVDDLRNQHKILAVKMKTVSVPAMRMAKGKRVCEGCLALCTTLKKLETVLLDHIYLEDTYLFPRALRQSSGLSEV